jgi:hypothetical protein
MNNIVKFFDFHATVLEDLSWSLDSYLKEDMVAGMQFQFDFLSHYEQLENMYLEFTEDEKELLGGAFSLMGLNEHLISETRTYLCM